MDEAEEKSAIKDAEVEVSCFLLHSACYARADRWIRARIPAGRCIEVRVVMSPPAIIPLPVVHSFGYSIPRESEFGWCIFAASGIIGIWCLHMTSVQAYEEFPIDARELMPEPWR